MKKCLPALALVLLTALAACQKSKAPEPKKEEPGTDIPVTRPVKERTLSITGMLFPVFAAGDFEVFIKAIRPGKDTVLKPDAQGVFRIYDLAAGAYPVSIRIAGTTVMDIAALVPATGTHDLGRLDFTGSPSIPLVKGSGTISGRISPAGMATVIRATHTGNLQTYSADILPDGRFTFSNLPAGEYRSLLPAGSRYTPAGPVSFTLTLAAGQTVDAGELAFYDNTDPASPNFISYEIDGIKNTRKAYVGASYQSPDLKLYTNNRGMLNTNSGIGRFVETDRLDIILDEVSGPGTYPLKGTASSTIRLSGYDRNLMGSLSPVLKIWDAGAAGGSGTVTITAIDPVTRTMSGTFSATLAPANSGAKNNKVISNGAFAHYKY